MTNKSINRQLDVIRAKIAARKGLNIAEGDSYDKDHYAMVNGLLYNGLNAFQNQIVDAVAGPAPAAAPALADTSAA